MIDAHEGLAIQLGGDIFADLPVAEGVFDIVGVGGRGGVDLQLQGQDDRLELIGPIPGVRANHGGELQIAQVDGVEVPGGRGGRHRRRVSQRVRSD